MRICSLNDKKKLSLYKIQAYISKEGWITECQTLFTNMEFTELKK